MSRAARGTARVYRPWYTRVVNGERIKRQIDVWYIRYHFNGRQIRESSHSTKKTDAEHLLKRRLGEMGIGRFLGPQVDRTTLGELLAMHQTDYEINGKKSLKRVKQLHRHLRAYFGETARVVTLTPDRIDRYARARLEEKATPATVNRELSALRRAFRLGLRAGKVSLVPPISLLSEHNVRQGFFEEPEFRAVRAHLPDALQPVAEFAYLTGWRKHEVVSLEWRQVDFKAKTVRLEPGSTKNQEGRTFPFASFPALGALLLRQRAATEAVERAQGCIVRWVFHRDGEPLRDFRGAWVTACKHATLPGRLFHDFRRTAVRNLERAGVPRSVAMKLTGHRTESVYRRYAIVSEADLAEGVKKLARLHADEGTLPRAVVPLAEARSATRKS